MEEQTEHTAPIMEEAELNEVVRKLCISKAEELNLHGYEQVTGEDVWECVSGKYKRGLPPLHQLVNDVLSLKAHTFMNWLMVRTLKGDQA
ncbi:post-transcriptional regulator [Tumebacillus sp. BK434]|uniref:post-transcriptional regulator n=1 Tax=Tumebacillus sp. BK434 TaxID=2512169 RepID=UPI001FB1F4D5|nr:post-transcriptional regulator [Tumebacillus sp. BK434]